LPGLSLSTTEAVQLDLRREVLRYFCERGDPMLTPAGLNTLETNSTLAWERSATLLEHVSAARGNRSLHGAALLDLGCGLGALTVVFAGLGARVTAVDPNAERFQVGAAVAARHGLDVRWIQSNMEALPSELVGFDIVIVNNSLCYLVDRQARSAALENIHRALRPRGVVVLREPNRLSLRDQFTGIPLLGAAPITVAELTSKLLRKRRSSVRLRTRSGLHRELRGAGLQVVKASAARRPRSLPLPPRYNHVVGVRPG
jgi:2-polyprenyl-3-methyl-5-hydroxy-6-metoxy-1,4-benzoquinol methylase